MTGRKKTEQLLARWMEGEVRNTPDIKPRPDVYQRLEQKTRFRTRLFSSRNLRWLAVGTAGAFLVILTVLGPDIFRPFSSDEQIQTAGAPAFGLRKSDSEKNVGAAMEAPQKKAFRGKEEKSAAAPQRSSEPKKQEALRQLWLEIRKDGLSGPMVVDLLSPSPSIPDLTFRDNFRLVLRSTEVRYVSVFLSFSGGQILRLFPNETYSPTEKPPPAGSVVFLPSPQNWFFLQEAGGSAVLYVIQSVSSPARWDELYEKGELETQLRRVEEEGDDKTTVMSFTLRFVQR
ncbi:MAG: DUF4384 domain-containing protein [Candidatus Aminicenantes bacterium]|nr:DUF4384 domain-containing protein [Candidatus Aminicenantes bacterium]